MQDCWSRLGWLAITQIL